MKNKQSRWFKTSGTWRKNSYYTPRLSGNVVKNYRKICVEGSAGGRFGVEIRLSEEKPEPISQAERAKRE
jgi:hypothetical protein